VRSPDRCRDKSGRVNGIVKLATRPEPPTCTVASGDWQDRVQKRGTGELYR
jgi:hypothetical protein